MNDTPENLQEAIELPDDREADALDVGRSADESYTAPAKPVRRHLKHVPDSSYENYLFGKAGTEDHPAWSDSMKGRAAIRLVSRGIVGSTFFAIGGRMARSQMTTYNEAEWKWDSSKPLQAIAKGIDTMFGRTFKAGIRGVAHLNGKTPEEAEKLAEGIMTFRQTRPFNVYDRNAQRVFTPVAEGQFGPAAPKVQYGRSYGNEVVSFTFDFAAASVGDAATRKILGVLDPNVKKTWLVNDEGNAAARGERKHVDVGKWAKATTQASWQIFSKNQGEDWAAGLMGYAFQMKLQSKLLNSAFVGKRADGYNRFEGFDIVADKSLNGGAYRRDTNKQIVGDYQLAGAIDLHARFVGYNWYTLMFREGYDHIGNALTKWKEDGFAIHAPKLPEHFNPLTAAVDSVAHTGRYMTKSFIKANMYMNPAVLPFWFMRTSQSKWRGENFIEERALHGQMQMAQGRKTNIFTPSDRIKGDQVKLHPYEAGEVYTHYPENTASERFEKGFSQVLNSVGKVQYNVGQSASRLGVKMAGKGLFPGGKWFNNLLTFDVRDGDHYSPRDLYKGRKNLMHEITDASFSYTPYMFLKQETQLRVDDTKGNGKLGQMDTAIYRFMDNVAAFNLRGTWNSVKEMTKLGTRFETEVPHPANDVAPVTVPTTTITAGNITRSPIVKPRAADDEHSNDNDTQSWAQSIVGSKVNPAQIHDAGATRH